MPKTLAQKLWDAHMAFAFARDGGFPFLNRPLRRVSPTFYTWTSTSCTR